MATNNTEINAAINEATKALGEMYPEDRDRLLDAAYAKRGLKRRKRLSPEARAAQNLAEAQAKAQAKIDEIAAKAGLRVMVAHPVETLAEKHPEVAARLDLALTGEVETAEERAARERFEDTFAAVETHVSTIVIP